MWRIGLVLLVLAGTAAQAQDGRLEGRVTRTGGGGVGGVAVVITELGAATVTDNEGFFLFHNRVAPGTYTLTFTLGDNNVTEQGVQVTSDETTTVAKEVDWEFSFAETITVYAASRRAERIVEAPASVTRISPEQIKREASHGQLPKLLEFTPGAEVTQSGVYDYNFNTRGFNSSLNRRVATLIDGRNTSVPFLGAQEWAAIGFPLDDLASVELVRGPSAALYGANASSGVLNMTTRDPRASLGGQLRLTAGELSTTNADFRWAGDLGGNWFVKFTAGVRDHGDYTVSRNGAAEYSVPCTSPGQTDCLPQEAVPLEIEDDDQVVFGSARVDKYLKDGKKLTLEFGTTELEGPAFQTGIGRVQLVDVERPWARFNVSGDHFNVAATYSGREADEQLALSSGTNLVLDTERINLEAQGNWEFGGGKTRLVLGGSYGEEDLDTLDPATGQQTLMFEPVDNELTALFGQVDFKVHPKVKLVLAGRWDESDLHDSEVSPKASVVYSVDQNHTLRLTYNEAFQVGNYSEYFLNVNAAPPADLSQLEGLCLLSGVTDCGLAGPALGGPGTPVRALGNEDLEVEEVKMIELGYSGIIADKAYLTVDVYSSENENFITDLIPQLGTSLGRVNLNFGPWVGSTAAESSPTMCPGVGVTTVADCIRILSPLLSNQPDGSNIIAAVSYTNFGDVDTEGVDLGLNYYINNKWMWQLSYSYFDFDIKSDDPNLENLLVPNSPENKAATGVTYTGEKFDGTVNFRWTDEFRWGVGPFQGDVKSYETVDVTVNYRLNDNWLVGANISNLLDDEHYQSFGGDLLERRALGHVLFSWQ
jgi:iron complex outermembrane receptor protein